MDAGCEPRMASYPAVGMIYKAKNIRMSVFLFGAEGETRTLTVLPPVDFESTTSTSSATPAMR